MKSRGEARRVFLEASLVAFVGIVLGLAANRLSARGLYLTRNYFPLPAATGHGDASRTTAKTSPGDTSAHFSGSNEVDSVGARLKERGLRLVSREEAGRLFADPRYQEERVIFVDARNDEHYHQGHVPGAYQLDPYYPDRYVAEVLPACQLAEMVVVYCTGGRCEDSELAAVFLKDNGIPADRLGVYGGGMEEWTRDGRNVETGERRSGVFQPPRP